MIGDTITRKEVETKLASVGDYVKMDFLQQVLKKNIDFDTKRFVMTKLAFIYETKQMFLEAGKLMRTVADINTTFEGKYNDFAKSMELYIKAGEFDEADLSFKKALACSNPKQKDSLKKMIKETYKTRAAEMIKKDKRKNAADIYERLISLPFLDVVERKNAQAALLQLYQKLGKIREFYALDREIKNPQPMKPQVEEKKRYDDFNIDDLLK